MTVGETAHIHCPPDYAYGSKGAGGVIPPNAYLVFVVEMLKVNSKLIDKK
jgi:FKBP-type peptidyl-prolyl cis-trans isomerase